MVASDGFMMNIATVLLDLSDPFLDNAQKERMPALLTRHCFDREADTMNKVFFLSVTSSSRR